MDMIVAREIVTVLAFLGFLGIVWWAYGGRRKSRFEEAALAPFDDEERARIRRETEQAHRKERGK